MFHKSQRNSLPSLRSRYKTKTRGVLGASQFIGVFRQSTEWVKNDCKLLAVTESEGADAHGRVTEVMYATYKVSIRMDRHIRGWPRPEKKNWKNQRNKEFISLKTRAKRERASSSPNASSTWLIFLFPRTHASPPTCNHSASSVLAVRISCRVIAVFVFRKPLWMPLTSPPT
jgi:hypothetical protein